MTWSARTARRRCPTCSRIPDGRTPEEWFLSRETNDDVGEIYCQLTVQQKTVLAYRFGLMGEPPLTLQETGERIGVSRERVRQIENAGESSA